MKKVKQRDTKPLGEKSAVSKKTETTNKFTLKTKVFICLLVFASVAIISISTGVGLFIAAKSKTKVSIEKSGKSEDKKIESSLFKPIEKKGVLYGKKPLFQNRDKKQKIKKGKSKTSDSKSTEKDLLQNNLVNLIQSVNKSGKNKSNKASLNKTQKSTSSTTEGTNEIGKLKKFKPLTLISYENEVIF